MKKATKLADIIEIERELQNVAYEIDSMTGNLKKWNSLVSFATVSVQVQEVVEPTKEEPSKKAGLGARMLYSLKDSLEGLKDGFQVFMIILMYILPYLLIVGAVTFIVLKLKRRFKRTRKIEEKEERIDKLRE